jgi:hypothetical protein
MKTKAEVISDVIKSGCTLPEQALKKLKKKELQVILNKYKTPVSAKPIPKANVSLREFTDSEFSGDEEEEGTNKITVKFRKPYEDDLPKNEPILKRQNAMEKNKSRKEHQLELKKMVNVFSVSITDIIKQFKEDNDAECVVQMYNTTRAEIETEITDYLEGWGVDDDIYEYANGLLEIQKGRIERLLGIR